MKKLFNGLTLFILTFLAVTLTSCEDEWYPLRWSYTTASDDIEITFSDPYSGPYQEEGDVFESFSVQNTITAGSQGGEIVLTCENYGNLYFDRTDYKYNFTTDGISCRIVDNRVIINFAPCVDSEDSNCVYLWVKTADNKNPATILVLWRQGDRSVD